MKLKKVLHKFHYGFKLALSKVLTFSLICCLMTSAPLSILAQTAPGRGEQNQGTLLWNSRLNEPQDSSFPAALQIIAQQELRVVDAQGKTLKSWSLAAVDASIPMVGFSGPGELQFAIGQDPSELHVSLKNQSKADRRHIHVIKFSSPIAVTSSDSKDGGSLFILGRNGHHPEVIPMAEYENFFSAPVAVFQPRLAYQLEGTSYKRINFIANPVAKTHPYEAAPTTLTLVAQGDPVFVLEKHSSEDSQQREEIHILVPRNEVWKFVEASVNFLTPLIQWIGQTITDKDYGSTKRMNQVRKVAASYESYVESVKNFLKSKSSSEENLVVMAARKLARQNPGLVSNAALQRYQQQVRDSVLIDPLSTNSTNPQESASELDKSMALFRSGALSDLLYTLKSTRDGVLFRALSRTTNIPAITMKQLQPAIFAGGLIGAGALANHLTEGLVLDSLLTFADYFYQLATHNPVISFVSDKADRLAKGAIAFQKNVVEAQKAWATMGQDLRWLKGPSMLALCLLVVPAGYLYLASRIKFKNLGPDATVLQKTWTMGIQMAARLSAIAKIPASITRQKLLYGSQFQGLNPLAPEPGSEGLQRITRIQGLNNPLAPESSIQAKAARSAKKQETIQTRILPASELFAASLAVAIQNPEIDITTLNVMTELEAHLEILKREGAVNAKFNVLDLLESGDPAIRNQIRWLYERAVPMTSRILSRYLTKDAIVDMNDEDFNREIYQVAYKYQSDLASKLLKIKNSDWHSFREGLGRSSAILYQEKVVKWGIPFFSGYTFVNYSNKYSNAVASTEVTGMVNKVVPGNFGFSMLVSFFAYPGRFADAVDLFSNPESFGSGVQRSAREAQAGPVYSLPFEQLAVASSQQPTALTTNSAAESTSDKALGSTTQVFFNPKPGGLFATPGARRQWKENQKQTVQPSLKELNELAGGGSPDSLYQTPRKQSVLEALEEVKGGFSLAEFSKFYMSFLSRVTTHAVLGIVAITTMAQFIGFTMTSNAEFAAQGVEISNRFLWTVQSFILSASMATNIVITKFLIFGYAVVIPVGQYLNRLISANVDKFNEALRLALAMSANAARNLKVLSNQDGLSAEMQDLALSSKKDLREAARLILSFYKKNGLLKDGKEISVDDLSDSEVAKFVLEESKNPRLPTRVNPIVTNLGITYVLIAGYSTFYYFFQLSGAYAVKTIWATQGFSAALLGSLNRLSGNLMWLVTTMAAVSLMPKIKEYRDKQKAKKRQEEVQGQMKSTHSTYCFGI